MYNLPNKPTVITATITECTARWRSFTVQALYEFLAEVADYEHAHRVRLNHVPMIAPALLEYLATMSGVDSRDYVSWGSFELKRAIRLSLSASRPTNIQLCEVAHRTVKFPRVYVSATANDADKAIAQLNQVPIFLSRMEHFRKFVAEYMDVSWPVEKNANEPRHHRLNEVAEDVIKAQASAGWAILKTDFHNIRKKSMDEVYDAITRCCREKVNTLASAAEVWEKFTRLPISFTPSASTTPYRPKTINHVAQDEEYIAPGEDATAVAEEPSAMVGDDDIDEELLSSSSDPANELCAIVPSAAPTPDPKTLPCNQVLLRGAGACKKGPDCPYSHDQAVLKAAWVEVYNKLYRK